MPQSGVGLQGIGNTHTSTQEGGAWEEGSAEKFRRKAMKIMQQAKEMALTFIAEPSPSPPLPILTPLSHTILAFDSHTILAVFLHRQEAAIDFLPPNLNRPASIHLLLLMATRRQRPDPSP